MISGVCPIFVFVLKNSVFKVKTTCLFSGIKMRCHWTMRNKKQMTTVFSLQICFISFIILVLFSFCFVSIITIWLSVQRSIFLFFHKLLQSNILFLMLFLSFICFARDNWLGNRLAERFEYFGQSREKELLLMKQLEMWTGIDASL